MKLVITLATRNRPQQLIDTLAKSIRNLTHPETLLIVQADIDDHETQAAFHDAIEHGLRPAAGRLAINVQTREDTVGAKWNRALLVPADVYLAAADDEPFITPGYDSKILEAAACFPDGVGMIVGYRFPFSGVIAPTRRFCEILGGIFPEYFPFWFVDHWMDDVARMVGRISFANVQTAGFNGGETHEKREVDWWATWFDAAYLMREKQAITILNQLDEPQWRKDMLISSFPLTNSRSRWINQLMRETRHEPSGLSPVDDRYRRVKQKAIAMLPEILEGMSERRDRDLCGSWGAHLYRYFLTGKVLYGLSLNEE